MENEARYNWTFNLNFNKKNRMIVVAGVLAIILATAGIVYFTYSSIYSATLNILVAPASAEIKIDGKVYKNGVYEHMHPGTVKVEISKDGFETKKMDFEILAYQTTDLRVSLNGNEDYYEEHPEDQKALELLNEARGESEAETFFKVYPIARKIPIIVETYNNARTEYIYYRIDGGMYDGCKWDFCLKITDISGGNYDRAIEKIKSLGFNPEDYQIFYEDQSGRGHAY